MSEAFVDVSWRGLEVGKRIKLHAIHPGDAYLDHGTPMPVGTMLGIRTDDGLEFAVNVVRVHEQVGGSNEIPGMQVVPKKLEGAAKAWWEERATEAPAAPEPPPAPAPPPAPVAPVVPSPAALFSTQADPRSEITSRPTLTMSTVEMERAVAAAGGTDASRTEVMQAINADALDGVVIDTSASDDGLIDDGRRTMAMSAMDISAIVEAGESENSGAINGNGNGDDDSSVDGPSVDSGPIGAGATTKKRGRGKGKNKRR